MKKNDMRKSNLPQVGKNSTSFSKEYRPINKSGPKKTKDIKKLMISFGKMLAPPDLRDNATVRHFLDEHNMKGTVNEVLIARLYTMALYNGDIKAIKLIIDILNDTKGAGQGATIIQFITPPSINQEAPVDLTNDSWTVQPPVEEKED